MKSIYVIIFSVFIFQSNAQISEIKSAAKSHSGSTSSSSSSDYSYSGISGGDYCSDACTDVCLDVCLGVLIDVVLDHHVYVMQNREDYKTALSLDFIPHVGMNFNDNINMLPRIRGNWGAFALDYRANLLVELVDYAADMYLMHDILFGFNYYVTPNYKIRAETGILYGSYIDNAVNENAVAIDINSDDYKYLFSGETIFTIDQGGFGYVFTEYNINIGFRFFETKHLWGYVNVGGAIQEYYRAVTLYTFRTGLTYTIR